jgi:hypothetical protein
VEKLHARQAPFEKMIDKSDRAIDEQATRSTSMTSRR